MKIRWNRAILIAVAGLLAVTALALAKSTTVGVGTAQVKGHNEPVAVNSRGVTVYELAPESAHHLVCKSSACLSVWPPVRASGKLTKAPGVAGKLGTVKRQGFEQVTLNGHPLYTFVEDAGRRGKAEGEGINNFGGVWHVFRES
jgi:predicted lipoprotein with Yx(FWY)xxD motif